jgi:carbamoyltransferase
MLILGICGGLSLAHETRYDVPEAFPYDGAAVLLRDGVVLAASEEERLNRIPRSGKFPSRSLRYCLESQGLRVEDVDRFAYYTTEPIATALLARMYLTRPDVERLVDARTMFSQMLASELGGEVDPRKLVFVQHKLTHALSAFGHSGWDESLVLVLDNDGGVYSGSAGSVPPLTSLAAFPQSKSLIKLIENVIPFLGYGIFEELKVMELAPYGDPSVYRGIFESFYTLLPEGNYELHLDRLPVLFQKIAVRKKDQPITQAHKDLASSLQETLERIVLHILSYQRQKTGLSKLCIAGGVAHNCIMNSKVLYSGLFEQVFVHPAAHDAGTALGAALHAHYESMPEAKPQPLKHMYWGPDVGDEQAIGQELARWERFVTFERAPDVARRTAQLLANGAVVGWVQGRSEFGPRALGNRSIVADPRPASNKDRINQMVKKREGYRPFAPSAQEEHVREYFELPQGINQLPYMIFVVKVRQDKQALLGAITHVDGTARLQTVSKETNPEYWKLLEAFREQTGVPVLLNTSFNNNVEPIVDSVRDAVVSYLTTELDYLVVGDFVVKKKAVGREEQLGMVVELPRYVRVQKTRGYVEKDRIGVVTEVRNTFDTQFRKPVSEEAYEVLARADGRQTLGQLLQVRDAQGAERVGAVVQEVMDLWAQRLVTLLPSAGTR